MKRAKLAAVCKSLLWGVVVLLFPIASGVLSVIFSLDSIRTLFLQGASMLAALIPPVILVLTGKWSRHDIGFGAFDAAAYKKALYFIPVLAVLLPTAVRGFYVKSVSYVFGCLFLYLFVGIAEELYFRGIIPRYLGGVFSENGTVLLSTLIFGMGHAATAFGGSGGIETALTVFNALIFGWLAMEMTFLTKNIVPAIIIHFLFDFETKIGVISGGELLLAEGVRGAVMFFAACWLFRIRKNDNCRHR